jgi:hypothetical protein
MPAPVDSTSWRRLLDPENGYVLRVGKGSFTQRTKSYLGMGPDFPSRKPSLTRLVVVSVLVIALGVGFASNGHPGITAFIWFGAVWGVGAGFYLRWRPQSSPVKGTQGWRMDPTGNWRWWNGSAFTNPPADQPPDKRKIGPEIEW